MSLNNIDELIKPTASEVRQIIEESTAPLKEQIEELERLIQLRCSRDRIRKLI